MAKYLGASSLSKLYGVTDPSKILGMVWSSTPTAVDPGTYTTDLQDELLTLGDGTMGTESNGRLACKRDDQRIYVLFMNPSSSTDNLWLSYADGSAYSSWSNLQITSDTNTAYEDKWQWAMDMDSSGILHVAYVGESYTYGSGTIKVLWYMTYNTNTHAVGTSPTPIAYRTDSYDQANPCVVCDTDDVARITWQGKGWGTNAGVYQMCYTSSADSGDWPYTSGDSPHLTDTANDNVLPVIDVNSEGDEYIFWIGQDAGLTNAVNNVLYKKYTTSWSSTQIGADDTLMVTYMGFCISRFDDSLHIVLARRYDASYRHGYYRVANSDVWDSGEESVFTYGDGNTRLQIYPHDDGQVPCVLYHDANSIDYAYMRWKDEGTTWKHTTLLLGGETRSQAFYKSFSFIWPEAGMDFNKNPVGPEIIIDFLDDIPTSTTSHIFYKSWSDVT